MLLINSLTQKQTCFVIKIIFSKFDFPVLYVSHSVTLLIIHGYRKYQLYIYRNCKESSKYEEKEFHEFVSSY